MEFGEIESNQQKSLFTAVCLFLIGDCYFGIYITSGFVEGLGQQFQIFVRTLDTIKWRFGSIAHCHALQTAPARGRRSSDFNNRLLFSHNPIACDMGIFTMPLMWGYVDYGIRVHWLYT